MDSPLATPKLTDRPVREPASDWASSTLDALSPISSAGDPVASNPATPGLNVPGAFPDPHPKSAVVQQDIQYVKDAAINALQTAKGYVGGYLPPSITAYLQHNITTDNSLPSEPRSQDLGSTSSDGGTHTVHQSTNISLPSQEISQNIHPESSDGAGTLPGPPGEIGAAVLPEERMSHQKHGSNSGALRSETGIAILPEERRQQTLPSHDDDPPFMMEQSSRGGVGTLPGAKEEVGVALLPEERTPSTSVQDRDSSLPANGSPLSVPPISLDGNANAHASHPIAPNTSARAYSLASDDVKFKGVPLSGRFQKESDQEQLSPTEKSIDERRNLEQVQSDKATAGHGTQAVGAAASPNEHETLRKKPGFMDKLKGEVKVISGKLSHKESKVEEGRKMMGRDIN